MISRRGVLLSSLAMVSGAAVWRFHTSSEVQAIVQVLRKRLDYLRLSDDDLLAFADDLVARHVVSSEKLKAYGGIGLLYEHFTLLDSEVSAVVLRHGEERIVSFFLLSSDFFLNGADERLPVRYLQFYDPLNRPCGNPFARLA